MIFSQVRISKEHFTAGWPQESFTTDITSLMPPPSHRCLETSLDNLSELVRHLQIKLLHFTQLLSAPDLFLITSHLPDHTQNGVDFGPLASLHVFEEHVQSLQIEPRSCLPARRSQRGQIYVPKTPLTNRKTLALTLDNKHTPCLTKYAVQISQPRCQRQTSSFQLRSALMRHVVWNTCVSYIYNKSFSRWFYRNWLWKNTHNLFTTSVFYLKHCI